MKKHEWYSEFGEYTIEEYVKERILADADEMGRLNLIVSLVPKDTSTLLDVGCGVGIFLDLLYKKRKIKGMGIDISEDKVNLARKHNILVEKGNVGSLRFDDCSFDVVTALEVLEHLPYGTYKKALKEIARCAKKAIIISVPYNEKRQFIKCPYCGTIFNPNYHLRVFNENTLSSLFPGFKVKKMIKIGAVYRIPLFLEYMQRMLSISGKLSLKNVEFVCPACGFSKPPSKEKGGNSKPFLKKALRSIWKFIPKLKQARWIIAIYIKSELHAPTSLRVVNNYYSKNR
jgi:2-polyprenyl-3-methyl-5-hydroxy-6-metoxy-1,4-benzoquinol methylase